CGHSRRNRRGRRRRRTSSTNFIGGNQACNRDGGGVRAGRGKRSGRSHKLILHLELLAAGRVACLQHGGEASGRSPGPNVCAAIHVQAEQQLGGLRDRKSTRLNSSHGSISYAVFCLKKKKKNKI